MKDSIIIANINKSNFSFPLELILWSGLLVGLTIWKFLLSSSPSLSSSSRIPLHKLCTFLRKYLYTHRMQMGKGTDCLPALQHTRINWLE